MKHFVARSLFVGLALLLPALGCSKGESTSANPNAGKGNPAVMKGSGTGARPKANLTPAPPPPDDK